MLDTYQQLNWTELDPVTKGRQPSSINSGPKSELQKELWVEARLLPLWINRLQPPTHITHCDPGGDSRMRGKHRILAPESWSSVSAEWFQWAQTSAPSCYRIYNIIALLNLRHLVFFFIINSYVWCSDKAFVAKLSISHKALTSYYLLREAENNWDASPRFDILRTSGVNQTQLIFEVRPALSFFPASRLPRRLAFAVLSVCMPSCLFLVTDVPLPWRASSCPTEVGSSYPWLGVISFPASHPRACPFPSVLSHRWTLSTRKAELMLSHPSTSGPSFQPGTHVFNVYVWIAQLSFQACDSCQEHLLPVGSTEALSQA